MPPVDQTRWEATNTQSLECCVHQTRLPRCKQPFAAPPKHANDGNASRPPPLRYTPLRDLRSVPLRVVGLLAKLKSWTRHEGAEGGAPPTAVPPTKKTRPNIYLTGTPTMGSKAAIRDTPRLNYAPPTDRHVSGFVVPRPSQVVCSLHHPPPPYRDEIRNPPTKNTNHNDDRTPPNRVKERPDRRPHLYRENRHRRLRTLCCIERFAVLNSASDQLGHPDRELTPNSIMTDLTEHYVPNSVTRVREHKSGSHVPNIFSS